MLNRNLSLENSQDYSVPTSSLLTRDPQGPGETPAPAGPGDLQITTLPRGLCARRGAGQRLASPASTVRDVLITEVSPSRRSPRYPRTRNSPHLISREEISAARHSRKGSFQKYFWETEGGSEVCQPIKSRARGLSRDSHGQLLWGLGLAAGGGVQSCGQSYCRRLVWPPQPLGRPRWPITALTAYVHIFELGAGGPFSVHLLPWPVQQPN